MESQDKHTPNRSPQKYVQALAKKTDFSLDALKSFFDIRKDEFKEKIQQQLHSIAKWFEELCLKFENITRAEEKNNSETDEARQNLEATEKKITKITADVNEAEDVNGFDRAIHRRVSFWVLHILTTLIGGLWTFVMYFLVRSDITFGAGNVFNAVVKYFASYSAGVPAEDIAVILFLGIGYCGLGSYYIFFVKYQKNKLIDASPKWHSKERLMHLSCFIIPEVLFTILYIVGVANASSVNLGVAQNWKVLLLDGFLILLPWLFFQFLYKASAVKIREKAERISGEIEVRKLRKKLNDQKEKRTDLKNKLQQLKKDAEELKIRKEKFHEDASNFISDAESWNGDQYLRKEKQSIFGICENWMETYEVDMIMNGQNTDELIEGYKVSAKNIADDTLNSVQNIVDHANKTVEEKKTKIKQLINKMEGSNTSGKKAYGQFLPAVVFLIAALSLFGCQESKLFSEEEKSEAVNIIIATDLSDRFLQDKNTNFLPVEFDRRVIGKAYQSYEQRINSAYLNWQNVNDVEGNFCVLPIPMPHESRRNISGLGFCSKLSDLPVKNRWEHFEGQRDSVLEQTESIYDKALDYRPTGVDVWSFFESNVQHYVKRSDSSQVWRNKIILLTDGYLYFDTHLKNKRRSDGYKRDYLESSDMDLLRRSKDWEKVYSSRDMGFLPIGDKFTNTEILVIGINPPEPYRASAVERPIIQRYWKEWLNEMGIQHVDFLMLNSPATDDVVQEFISGK